MKILELVLDLLFPPRCVFCQKLLKTGEQGICSHCQTEVPWIVGKDAEQKFEFVSNCVSPLWFQGNVRESIHRYKFENHSGYAKTYGKLIAQSVYDHLSDEFDLITWVPLSKKRLRTRGYDQAELLAKHVADYFDCAVMKTLQKVRNTNAQSGIKDDSARRANVMGAYEAVDPKIIAGKRILLIDDVVTTGSTLSECARILLTAGAVDVVCASIARARGEKTRNKH